jgi:anti-anti-sigma factor
MTVQGELDLAAKPAAEEALRRAQHPPPDVMVLDLSGVSFIDSAGLHVIIDANIRQREAGRRLVAIVGLPQAQRMLKLTGVVEQLELADRITAAQATAEVSDAH